MMFFLSYNSNPSWTTISTIISSNINLQYVDRNICSYFDISQNKEFPNCLSLDMVIKERVQ